MGRPSPVGSGREEKNARKLHGESKGVAKQGGGTIKTILVIVALHAAATIAATAATSGFVRWRQNNHEYKAVYVAEGISWTQAAAEAEQAGGYLATITSPEENRFVFRLVDKERFWNTHGEYDNFGPWIGGCQQNGAQEPGCGWQWVTGEDFFYNNWAPLEPSGRWKGEDENRLQFYCKGDQRFGRWNDSLDTLEGIPTRGYVIEKGEINAASRGTVVTEPLAEQREFTGKNGKVGRGQVVAYDMRKDTVIIENENGHTSKVRLSHLSPADQTYVREWHLIKEFCATNRIRISAKEIPCEADREMEVHDNENTYWDKQTMESIGYEITLENRSSADLQHVAMEYCIYFEQERPHNPARVVDQGIKCGTLDVGTLASKVKARVETESVVLFKRDKEYGNALKGEILGIWIRAYLPLADGSKVMREYGKPDSLMRDRQWATSVVPDGINN